MTDLKLSELDVPGFIYLKLRAEDSETNRKVFDAFRMMAKVECRNDYTIALRKLLEYYEADAKIELLWRAMQAMENRIEELERAKTTKHNDEGAF